MWALWAGEKAFIETLLAQEPADVRRRWTCDAIYEERLNRYDRDARVL